jgi:hypothetical protein
MLFLTFVSFCKKIGLFASVDLVSEDSLQKAAKKTKFEFAVPLEYKPSSPSFPSVKKDQAGAVPRWDLWLLGAEIILTEDNEENKGCTPESQGNFYRTQRRKRR